MDIMRNRFSISLAGLIIDIDTTSTSACVLCRDYHYNGTADISIKITKKDVEREYQESTTSRHNQVSAETTAVYRKIVEQVLNYNTILMHGAVVAVKDNAYMFTAPSGTGKTTHIKLWLQKLEDAIVINGDKPLIRVFRDNIMACGTPWSGNENLNTNTMKPLKAIVLLERSEKNSIERISFSEAYMFLLQQTFIPKETDKAKKVLELLASLDKHVSFYRFHCNNYANDCFDVSYKAIAE